MFPKILANNSVQSLKIEYKIPENNIYEQDIVFTVHI